MSGPGGLKHELQHIHWDIFCMIMKQNTFYTYIVYIFSVLITINPPGALTEEAKALQSKYLTTADMVSIIVHCYKKHFHFSFFLGE